MQSLPNCFFFEKSFKCLEYKPVAIIEPMLQERFLTDFGASKAFPRRLNLSQEGSKTSLGRSVDRSVARSIVRSLDRSIDRSIDRSVARSIARSLDRWIFHSTFPKSSLQHPSINGPAECAERLNKIPHASERQSTRLLINIRACLRREGWVVKRQP